MVDGQLWPAADADTVWLPAGPHSIEAAPAQAGPPAASLHLLRLNADLKAARSLGARGIEFSYQSASRALAILDRPPKTLQLDGAPEAPVLAGPTTLLLPRGHHVVTLTTD